MVTLLETSTSVVVPASYHSKLRQFGAMLDLHRNYRGEEQMLVVSDTSKAEISAGSTRKYTQANQERWSVMAGGRDAAHETPLTTIGREIPEEFQEIAEERLHQPLPAEIAQAVAEFTVLPEQYATLFPFIVGQLKYSSDTAQLTKINEVAAAPMLMEFDHLPSELRQAFHYLEEKKMAQWMGVKQLALALEITRLTGDPKVGVLPVRPQLLTLAAIHEMQRVNHYSDEAIVQKVLVWNKQIAGRLHRLAKKHDMIVNNGVFTQRGTIYKNLPEEDRSYLGNYE